MDGRTCECFGVVDAADRRPFKVAIIGEEPLGFFAAWRLATKTSPTCQISLLEASDRPGNKIQTGQFACIGPYESGVIEMHDYACLGTDLLHDLTVKDLVSRNRSPAGPRRGCARGRSWARRHVAAFVQAAVSRGRGQRICALSPSDQRRRPTQPVITSTCRTATAFGSSLRPSGDKCRGNASPPLQEKHFQEEYADVALVGA
jgi:hypothetical protein